MDDQAQVAKDIEAAVDRLNATTIHATWDEKAEEGTVQATLGKRPFMIAPSSTIDSRSDLAFHLRANGEALQLSVVSESGTRAPCDARPLPRVQRLQSQALPSRSSGSPRTPPSLLTSPQSTLSASELTPPHTAPPARPRRSRSPARSTTRRQTPGRFSPRLGLATEEL